MHCLRLNVFFYVLVPIVVFYSRTCSIWIFKSPKRSGETLFLLRFFVLFFFFFHLFFFPPKFCPQEFSVTTGRIVLKFWDMVDMDVKLCKRVSKSKMSDSKAGPRACPKPPKFCQDYFLLTTEVIVVFFLYDKD